MPVCKFFYAAFNYLRAILACLFLALVCFGLPLFLIPAALVFQISPLRIRRLIAQYNNWIALLASKGFEITLNISACKWETQGLEALKQAPEKKNCLLIGNHISWADPIITHGLLGTYLPQRRYLIKESLTYIPLFGQALVSVGMPYISQRHVAKGKKANRQIAKRNATQIAKIRQVLDLSSCTIAVYPESTRFTLQKQKATKSPHKHLLAARSGGISFLLQTRPDIQTIYDCTLVYRSAAFHLHSPPKLSLWNVLSGQAGPVHFIIRKIDQNALGSEQQTHTRQQSISKLLRKIWTEKEELIASYQGEKTD